MKGVSVSLEYGPDTGPGPIGLYYDEPPRDHDEPARPRQESRGAGPAATWDPRAEYKSRYIAVPRSTLAKLLGKGDLDEYGVGPVDFRSPPSFSKETREDMRRALLKLKELANGHVPGPKSAFSAEEVITHEIAHHDALRNSVFWDYCNSCVLLRRILIARAVGTRGGVLSRADILTLSRLFRDINSIKQVAHPAEEDRLLAVSATKNPDDWLADERVVAHLEDLLDDQCPPERKECLRQLESIVDRIQASYQDPDDLRSILDGDTINLRRERPQPRTENGKLAVKRMFLQRYSECITGLLPFLARIGLNPAVWWSFLVPFGTNLVRLGRDISELPVIRTFSESGLNVALDPQGAYVNEDMCATALEAQLVRGKFTDGAYERACWWIYLLQQYCRDELKDREDQRNLFLSRYIFDRDEFLDPICWLDRLARARLRNAPMKGDDLEIDSTFLDQTAAAVEKKAVVKYGLSPVQIFTYIRHYYDHGI